MKKILNWVLALGAASLMAACGGSDDPAPQSPPPTIVGIAANSGFSLLNSAVSKAGLVATLSDTNAQLTVFAPTNDAFTALATSLGFADANAMITALSASDLNKILTYHVLPGKLNAAALASGGASQPTAYTFEGSPARLTLDTSNGVRITDAALTQATVTTADITAVNGVVHVVNKVLVPPGVLNIVQMAQVNPTFSTLVSSVVTANLAGTLSGAGPFTVFAPTNDAFAAIATTVAGLSTQQLASVLTYHVLGSQVLAADIPFGTPVTTVLGQNITINAGTPPTITDTTATPALITATNVRASNGVIHVIDKVLIPALAN